MVKYMQIQLSKISIVMTFFFSIFYSAIGSAWTINNDFENQKLGDICGYSAHKGGSNWWNASKSSVTDLQKYGGKHGCSLSVDQGSKGGDWGGGQHSLLRLLKAMKSGFGYACLFQMVLTMISQILVGVD